MEVDLFLMIRRPPRSTQSRSSAASDVYKRQLKYLVKESQTPRGLNEQGVKELRKSGFYRSTEKTLNSILKRLNKV